MEYFIKVQEPKKLRISMMIAARDSVILISMLESFGELRKEKANLVISIKDDFKEINALCKQLADLIAEEKIRKEIIESAKLQMKTDTQKIQRTQIEQNLISKESLRMNSFEPSKTQYIETPKIQLDEEVISSIAPKKTTEIDRLEYTLAQIEQKLAELQK